MKRSAQLILAEHVPAQVWYASAVLRELGRHPHYPPPPSVDTNSHPVDAALDVSMLFGYSANNIKAATDSVVRGDICPDAVLTLSRLYLATSAAMNTLGGDGSLHYAFRAVIRRHLEQLGPRTGVWEAVRDVAALVGRKAFELQCKAWSTAPWTADMSDWLASVPMWQLCNNKWWWLVTLRLTHRTWNKYERLTALRGAAARGGLLTVKRVASSDYVHKGLPAMMRWWKQPRTATYTLLSACVLTSHGGSRCKQQPAHQNCCLDRPLTRCSVRVLTST